jgi:hypothetical protein
MTTLPNKIFSSHIMSLMYRYSTGSLTYFARIRVFSVQCHFQRYDTHERHWGVSFTVLASGVLSSKQLWNSVDTCRQSTEYKTTPCAITLIKNMISIWDQQHTVCKKITHHSLCFLYHAPTLSAAPQTKSKPPRSELLFSGRICNHPTHNTSSRYAAWWRRWLAAF